MTHMRGCARTQRAPARPTTINMSFYRVTATARAPSVILEPNIEKRLSQPPLSTSLSTREAPCRSAHRPTAARRDMRPINRAQRLRLLAGLILGHLVELVLAICVAHANANTGAHACDGRSRHRCACPREWSASARPRASAHPAACMEHGLTHARHTARHAAAAVRSTTLSGLCVPAAEGAAHGTSRARRERPGWCRTPACGRCFLCSYPTAPLPAIAVANTSAAELNALLHRVSCSVPGSGEPASVWRCGMRSEARPRVA